MQDKTWTDTLVEDDVKFLQDVEVMTGNLISQVYIFIDLFHQYVDLIQSAAIFSPEFTEPKENDANVYPTQTFPDPAMGSNRAERRAQEKPKKKTPFDIVQGKK
jgi:hypothetical protein